MTGARGPLSLPPPRAQGHRPHTLQMLPGGATGLDLRPPRPSSEWLAQTKRDWKALCADRPGQLQERHVPAVRRLFKLRDQFARAMQGVDAAMLVKGSVGQIRLNPLADYAVRTLAAIDRMENELGLTPMGEARLGLTAVTAAVTLEELNKALESDLDTTPDPRLAALQLADQDGGRTTSVVAGSPGLPVDRG